MSAPDGAVTVRAHAKINVFLRVMGARADGYHDLESLILPISLHDVVTARSNPDRAGTVEMAIHAASAEPIPSVDNLAVKASAILAAAAFPKPASRPVPLVEVEKWIPIAAGLGGGSADAAATLQALNELWGAGLDETELAAIGLELGSDVPAMLAGKPVMVTGRGERLTPVHCSPTWWVLRPFEFPVRAADAYAWWDDSPSTGSDPGALVAASETGDLELLGSAMFNDLQEQVVTRHAEVKDTIDAFRSAGAVGAIMSGSGPTVAALARDEEHARRLADAMPGSIVVSAPPVGDRLEAG